MLPWLIWDVICTIFGIYWTGFFIRVRYFTIKVGWYLKQGLCVCNEGLFFVSIIIQGKRGYKNSKLVEDFEYLETIWGKYMDACILLFIAAIGKGRLNFWGFLTECK